MRMFDPSNWKVGQPTLRAVVVLSVLGAASYVIGACTGHRPSPERQAAAPRTKPQLCMDGGTPADAGTITYTTWTGLDSGTGFDPSELCLVRAAPLTFKNQAGKDITLCFRHELSDGGWDDESPFADGGTRITLSHSKPLLKKTRGPRDGGVYDVEGVYDFKLTGADGECDWDAGTDAGPPVEEGNAGTLEVGTGGTGEPLGSR